MSARAPPPLPPLPRSRFVRMVGWITIAVCSIGLLLLALEVLAFVAVAQGGLGGVLQKQVATHPEAATVVATLSRWLPWVLGVIVAQLAFHLVAAIGLLKRDDVARRAFVAALWFDAIWQCATIPMQWWLTGRIQAVAFGFTANAQDPRMQAQLQSSLISSHVFGVAASVAFAGLYLWLARSLSAPRVRAEFSRKPVRAIARDD